MFPTGTSDFSRRIEAIKKRRTAPGGTIALAPFSDKQRTAMGWWKTKKWGGLNGVIADGAVRSGKTVALSIGFVLWLMSAYDGQCFAICGRTIGSVRRNILNWLLPMLPSFGMKVNYKRAENRVEISWKNSINVIYIFGAKDERAQDLIQGLTLAGVMFDEAALLPESFVSQATARCSVEGSKFWFSCNPLGPHHWFKTEWIDRAEERRLLVLKFHMSDNKSLSEEVLERYRTMYTGVFHRRYILGEWCVAEGLVYPMFDRERNIKSEKMENYRVFLSCDYGTNNPFALGLCGGRKGENGTELHLFSEYYHDGRKQGQMTDGEYADALEQFVSDSGASPQYVIVDPSASSFITELRRRGWKVIRAKNAVLEGIHAVSEALSESRMTVDESCKATLKEFDEYVWDTGAALRGEDKPCKQNDHAMDMLRYALMTFERMEQGERKSASGRGAV